MPDDLWLAETEGQAQLLQPTERFNSKSYFQSTEMFTLQVLQIALNELTKPLNDGLKKGGILKGNDQVDQGSKASLGIIRSHFHN